MIRPSEVRTMRIFRYGMSEAARCALDDESQDDSLFYHKDAGIFTTSLAKPTPEEIANWKSTVAMTSSLLSSQQSALVAGSAVQHCVICRTASGEDETQCHFCGAGIRTGVGLGDEELETETTVSEHGDGTDDTVSHATTSTSAQSGVFPAHACVVSYCFTIVIAVCVRYTGRKGGLLTVQRVGSGGATKSTPVVVFSAGSKPVVIEADVPHKPHAHKPVRRAKQHVDANLAAQLFGLKSDTVFHKQQAGRKQLPPKQKKVSPYQNIKGPKPLIVLDAPNIAMRCGRGKQFTSAGITAAIVYYQRRGHKVVAFLPESYLDADKIAGLKRAEKVSTIRLVKFRASRKYVVRGFTARDGDERKKVTR